MANDKTSGVTVSPELALKIIYSQKEHPENRTLQNHDINPDVFQQWSNEYKKAEQDGKKDLPQPPETVIAEMQRQLKDVVKVTGEMDEPTQKAVQKFQMNEQARAAAAGVVDKVTHTPIDSDHQPSAPATQASQTKSPQVGGH